MYSNYDEYNPSARYVKPKTTVDVVDVRRMVDELSETQQLAMWDDLVCYCTILYIWNGSDTVWADIVDPRHKSSDDHDNAMVVAKFMGKLVDSLLWEYLVDYYPLMELADLMNDNRYLRANGMNYAAWISKVTRKSKTLDYLFFTTKYTELKFIKRVLVELERDTQLLETAFAAFWENLESITDTDKRAANAISIMYSLLAHYRPRTTFAQTFAFADKTRITAIEYNKVVVEQLLMAIDAPSLKTQKGKQIATVIVSMIRLPNDWHQEKFDITQNKYTVVGGNTIFESLLTKLKLPGGIGVSNVPIPERSAACYGRSLANCGECKDPYRDDPQTRCIAICQATKRQCLRARHAGKSYCAQHFNTARHVNIPSVHDIHDHLRGAPVGRDVYQQDPSTIDQLRRYPTTQRPVNPQLTRVSKRTCPVGNIVLPVYRVSSLYYSKGWQNNKKYCGKFYFYEPESTVSLDLGDSVRVFGSKVHAYMVLFEEWQDADRAPPTRTYDNTTGIALDTDGIDDSVFDDYSVNDIDIPPGLGNLITTFRPLVDVLEKYDEDEKVVATVDYYFTLLTNDTVLQYSDVKNELTNTIPSGPLRQPLHVLFPSVNPRKLQVTIGQLDDLDGPICKLASYLGITTIILQHEVGSNDCVTEILDTRANSVDHLCTIPRVASRTSIENRESKIWYVDDGLLVVDKSGFAVPVKTTVDQITGHVTTSR
jgi:hypothetical protein